MNLTMRDLIKQEIKLLKNQFYNSQNQLIQRFQELSNSQKFIQKNRSKDLMPRNKNLDMQIDALIYSKQDEREKGRRLSSVKLKFIEGKTQKLADAKRNVKNENN